MVFLRVWGMEIGSLVLAAALIDVLLVGMLQWLGIF